MCDTGPSADVRLGRDRQSGLGCRRGAFRTRGGRDWHWLSCRWSSSAWTVRAVLGGMDVVEVAARAGCIARRCIGGSRGIWGRGSVGCRTGRIVRCRVPGRRRRWSRWRWRRCVGPIRGGDRGGSGWSRCAGQRGAMRRSRCLRSARSTGSCRRGRCANVPRNGPGSRGSDSSGPADGMWGIDIVGASTWSTWPPGRSAGQDRDRGR